MALKLHDHQVEAIAAIRGQFAKGKNRTLAVLATGAGKTIIYLSLVNDWAKSGKRVLILAHRRELIHQPVERAQQFFPELARKMGVVMAQADDPSAQVVVATIQTISRNQERLEAIGKFDYVVLDECHHGTAKSYGKLFGAFPDAKWLGVTATPFRRDGDSMAKIFDSVAYRYPITTAIDRGTLVPFEAFGFSLPVSVEGLEESEDGWSDEDLGTLLSAKNAIELVYEKWAQYCEGRKTICFTSSVGQAYATAKYFQARGVAAKAVDGSTPKKERDRILAQFRKGELQMVANCQVWTEGVDVPEASAALMVCPTKSDLAYVQKLGRILRTFPGKKNAVVLDFAPLEDRNIVMAGDILGVPVVEKKATEKARKSGVMVRAVKVDDYGLAVSIDPSELLVEALKYLAKGTLAWTIQGSLAVASVSENVSLAIQLPDVGRIAKAEDLKYREPEKWTEEYQKLYDYLTSHRLWVVRKENSSWNWEPVFSGCYSDMEKAITAGENATQIYYRPSLAKKSRKWRNRLASDAQVRYMRSLGADAPESCTCGQAAQLITYQLAYRTVTKVEKSVESLVMKGQLLQ